MIIQSVAPSFLCSSQELCKTFVCINIEIPLASLSLKNIGFFGIKMSNKESTTLKSCLITPNTHWKILRLISIAYMLIASLLYLLFVYVKEFIIIKVP